VGILNSALHEEDESNSTENSEEITDGNYDDFSKENGFLLAEIGDMKKQRSRMMTRSTSKWDGLHVAFQYIVNCRITYSNLLNLPEIFEFTYTTIFTSIFIAG